MKKKLFFLMAMVLTAVGAMAQVEPEDGGVYYIYNAEADGFITRGNTWGTQACIKPVGMPWKVSVSSEGKYTLRMYDLTVAGSTKGLGLASGSMDCYTDNDSPLAFVPDGTAETGYSLQMDGDMLYLMPSSGLLGWELGWGSYKWQFLTQAQYTAKLAAMATTQEAKVATTAGIDLGSATLESVVSTDNYAHFNTNDGIPTNDPWTVTGVANRGGTQNWGAAYGGEIFQGGGNYSKTITGLTEGIYKVTVRAMKRVGTNANCYTMGEAGYPVSDAYLNANGYIIPIKSWYEGCTSNSFPNNTGEFMTQVNAGKYQSSGYVYVGSDGKLDLSAISEAYWNSSWFLFDGVEYTRCSNPVTDADVTALEATMPTDAMDATVQKTMEDAKTALEGDKSGAHYNALVAAIENAKTSIAAYEAAKHIAENAASKAAAAEVGIASAYSAWAKAYMDGELNGNDEANAVEKAYQDGIAAKLSTDYVNKTSLITNPSFEDGLTGWTGDFSAQGNAYFDKEGTYYAEKWVASSSTLADGTLTQTLTNLPAGDYILTAKAQNIQQGDATVDPTGFYITVGNNKWVPVSNIAGTFAVAFTNGAAGDVTIGTKLDGCTGNWVCVDNFQLYKKFNLQDAKDCYATVTAVGAKVDDQTHNDLYAALEAAINADPQVAEDLATATENAWRQYYYDQLASEVIIETNYLKKGVTEDADKATLQAALDAAIAVYGDAIDTNVSSDTYKNALETLQDAVKNTVANEYAAAKTALEAQITTSTNTKGDLVYDTNKDDLDAAITTAKDAEAAANTVTKANVTALRNATTTLNTKTADVVAADAQDAKTALATAINEATTYNDNTVSVVSDVVAADLSAAIATAQAVKDDAATTAQQAKDAADALNAAKATAENDLKDFQTAQAALNDAITAAKAISYSYSGVTAYLNEAIATAQAVADAAKAKTTQELTDAKAALEAAVVAAAATNAAANTLAGDIATAQNTVQTMDNATDIASANDAIAAAQTALTVKTNGATELNDADQALKDAVKGFYDNNLNAVKADLAAKIAEAQDALDNTIAYNDAHYTALSDAIAAATAVKDNASSTPADMTAAIAPLNTAITDNVAADAQEAIDALTTAISNAQTQYSQRYITNQIYAEPLNTYVTEAQVVLTSGTAKEKKAKAEEYTTVNNGVTSNINAFLRAVQTNSTSLVKTIAKAKKYRDNSTKSTHTGVIEYLNDAIAVAENIVSTENTPVVSATMTIAEINAARDALKAAYVTDATPANSYANSIESNVTYAQGLIDNTLVDDTYKTTLADAITAANDALTKKENVASKGAGLNAALTALQTAISNCVNGDIADALADLNAAIDAANTAKAGLGYAANSTTLQTAIDAASTVAANSSATAKELVEATTTLNTAKDDVVKQDLEEATAALATALTDATALETSIKALSAKIDNYPTEKAAFNTAVLNDLTDAIKTATDVQDAIPSSTGLAKVEQVAALADAVTAANDALTLYYNTELQKLADEYTADKDLSNTIKATVTALDEFNDFEDKFDHAVEVYASVKANEGTYDAGDVIAARLDLKKAADDLKAAKAAWDKAVADLEAEIVAANTELAAIQTCHATIAATLQDAIDAADAVDAKKGETKTADLVTAYETLKAAVEAATYDDLHWDFTDATPDYKEGSYVAGNVTYTRSGSSIAEGKYGSFCLPFDVATSNFAKAYVPAPFAVYDATANTFQMFFKEVEETEIPAGTPFLAELPAVVDNKLALTNAFDVTVASVWNAAGAPVAKTTTIEVYDQTASSSFVTYDKNTKFVWNGTLAKSTETTNCKTFGSNGAIYKAGSYINPFRAYFEMVTTSSPAKDATILVNFGDDDDAATAIEEITSKVDLANGKVYSVDGKFLGNSTKGLKSGMYIINGKKVVK